MRWRPRGALIHSGSILADDPAVKAIVPFAARRYAQALGGLETVLSDSDYLVDGRFSAADIMVGYLPPWFPDHLAPYPGLVSHLHRLRQRPAYPRVSGG